MATVTTLKATETSAEGSPFAPFRPYRMTEEQYFRLAETGIISDKAPVFLWNGLLVEKMTKGRPHVVAVLNLYALVMRVLTPGWFVQPEQPIALGGGRVPEPDLTIVRGVVEDYRIETPRARDLGLVIEVSDSSLSADSKEMLAAYAREAIASYWIVNIPRNRIDVYSQPTGPSDSPTYGECRSYSRGEDVPLILDGQEISRIAVSDVL
jgi:Uma2 family endonuclease